MMTEITQTGTQAADLPRHGRPETDINAVKTEAKRLTQFTQCYAFIILCRTQIIQMKCPTRKRAQRAKLVNLVKLRLNLSYQFLAYEYNF